MIRQIRCKHCREKGVPRNNSSIGYYCEKQECQDMRIKKAKLGISKVRQSINKVSKKLSKEQAIYKGKRIIFLTENPNCVANLECCLGIATDVHHSQGRGKYLNDVSTWKPVCRPCHVWTEEHPKEAKELGLSKDRLCKE